MLKEHSQVVLNMSLPPICLEPGDVGVVVGVHNNGEAYEVKFLTMSGATIGVQTLLASDLRCASGSAIFHERELIASYVVIPAQQPDACRQYAAEWCASIGSPEMALDGRPSLPTGTLPTNVVLNN